MKPRKLNLYIQTLRYVKLTQLYHQVYYRVRKRIRELNYNEKAPQVQLLSLDKGILYQNSYRGNGCLQFINLEKQFDCIDWNFGEYGKLWAYNLNYFEYLHQETITKEESLGLIKDFISKHATRSHGIEPYPISLRGINWIKFLSQNNIDNEDINTILYRDYQRLMDNLEYHLLGNHLLENAFSLLFGAYYFKEERMYFKAKKLLQSQLKEQILKDGAHYELSPMYHQIILHRVLDCYNLIKNNSWKNQELLTLLRDKAQIMLSWLENISFKSGAIPKLNDAADGIAPKTLQLSDYARALGLQWKEKPMSDSGYRKFVVDDLECIIDVGQIAPVYQPGHAHADNLNFVLSYKGDPIIVDTGISTYEKNARRQVERSTASHNTVTINDRNSSEVWDGFRVGKRAETTVESETANQVVAFHNGYRALGVIHRRRFSKTTSSISIEDEVIGEATVAAHGHVHFHPDVKVKVTKTRFIINDLLELQIGGATNLSLEDYLFAEGFNKLKAGKKLVYKIEGETKITFQSVGW